MDVQVQRVPEALDERHRAAPGGGPPPAAARPAPERGEEGADEEAQDRRRELRVEGEPVAKREGEGEDPLPDGHPGQNRLDQMGGGVGHPPAAAGGAEAAPLAGKGDEAIPAALIAMDPDEAAGEDSAIEECPELPLHKPGDGTLIVPGADQEGLEMLPDGLVKDRRLGTARPIDGSRLPAPLTGRREYISRHGVRDCEGCARSRKEPRAGASCREGTSISPEGTRGNGELNGRRQIGWRSAAIVRGGECLNGECPPGDEMPRGGSGPVPAGSGLFDERNLGAQLEDEAAYAPRGSGSLPRRRCPTPAPRFHRGRHP